jgi:hypothetical protein
MFNKFASFDKQISNCLSKAADQRRAQPGVAPLDAADLADTLELERAKSADVRTTLNIE